MVRELCTICIAGTPRRGVAMLYHHGCIAPLRRGTYSLRRDHLAPWPATAVRSPPTGPQAAHSRAADRQAGLRDRQLRGPHEVRGGGITTSIRGCRRDRRYRRPRRAAITCCRGLLDAGSSPVAGGPRCSRAAAVRRAIVVTILARGGAAAAAYSRCCCCCRARGRRPACCSRRSVRVRWRRWPRGRQPSRGAAPGRRGGGGSALPHARRDALLPGLTAYAASCRQAHGRPGHDHARAWRSGGTRRGRHARAVPHPAAATPLSPSTGAARPRSLILGNTA